MVHLVHFKVVKLMDVKNTLGIKDLKMKHIPGPDIRADPGME